MEVYGDISGESQDAPQEGNGPQGEVEVWEGGHVTSLFL